MNRTTEGQTPVTEEQALIFLPDFIATFTPVSEVAVTQGSVTWELPILNGYRFTLQSQPYGTGIYHRSQKGHVFTPYAYRWKGVTNRQRALNTCRVKGWLIRKLDLIAKFLIDEHPERASNIGHLIVRPTAYRIT